MYGCDLEFGKSEKLKDNFILYYKNIKKCITKLMNFVYYLISNYHQCVLIDEHGGWGRFLWLKSIGRHFVENSSWAGIYQFHSPRSYQLLNITNNVLNISSFIFITSFQIIDLAFYKTFQMYLFINVLSTAWTVELLNAEIFLNIFSFCCFPVTSSQVLRQV